MHITTITAHMRLECAARHNGTETFVTGSQVLEAVRCLHEGGVMVKSNSFKNCCILSVRAQSSRLAQKHHNISVKVFNNMMLHITGTHSLEMIDRVVEVIRTKLEEKIGCRLT